MRFATAWGFPATAREAPVPSLLDDGLDRARYEAQRPGTDVVYRGGDTRFLNIRAGVQKP